MLNQIFKNLFRRKTRTLLTTVGIAVGVAMIVALGAMGEGIRTGYVSMFGGSGADLTLMQKGSYDITLSGVDEEVIAEVAAMPGIKEATGMVVGNITAPNMPYFFIFGYDPQSFAVQRFKITLGQTLGNSRSTGRGQREIILGTKAAEALKMTVGDILRLPGGSYRVVGLYETGSGFEDGAAVISLADSQELMQKHRQVGAVQIKLRDPRQIDAIRAQLERRYPRLTASQSDDVANQQQMVSYLQGFALGIALLAVVIGGVGMTNTVMMSAFERTREIGALRALGWSRRRVLAMILGESVGLGIVGGILGCIFGAAMIAPMGQIPALSFLQGRLTPELLVQGMLTAVILGAVGGIYPALWASQLMPVEAMRYESGAADSNFTAPFKSELLRSLWRRRGRTALTTLGIGIGLASVIALGGISDAFMAQFKTLLMAGDVDLLVRQAGASDVGYSAVSERAGREILAMPGVKSVSGMIFGAVTLEDRPEMPFFMILGYAPNEPAIQHFKIVEGRMLSGNREIMLGRAASDLLNVRIGASLRLGEINFRVVGLYETGTAWEESGGVISLRDSQMLLGKPRQVSMYAVKLNDPQQSDAMIQQIEQNISEIAVSRSTELSESMPEMQNMYVMIWAIGALAVIVGGIGMMNTMVMSVFERTREIGTLRALGWRRRRVLAGVIQESLLLSLLGFIFGLLLAVSMVALMQLVPVWGEWMQLTLSPGLLLQTLLISLALGLVGGVYPAWRASQLSPVEALRYE